MTLSIIIIIVSFVLEIILNNFLPYMIGDLSLFTPMFTLISLLIIYPLLKKNIKRYFIIAFIMGIIYDLLFTNLLFFNGILFILIAYLIHLLYKYFEFNILNIAIEIVLIIIIYETTTALVILSLNLVPVTTSKLIYKISHSLISNIIYGELLYLIISHLPKKYKSISIN